MSKGTKTVIVKTDAKAKKPAAKVEPKKVAKATKSVKEEKVAVKAAKPAPKKVAKAEPEKKVTKVAPKTVSKKVAEKPAKVVEKKIVEKASAKKVVAKTAKTVKKTSKKSAEVLDNKILAVFEADCPLATTVSVAGTFNNWAVDKDMLKKEKSGFWKLEMELEPGDYEYKFVCDGINWDMGDNKIKHV